MVALLESYTPDEVQQHVAGAPQVCPKGGFKRVPVIGQFKPQTKEHRTQNRVGSFFIERGTFAEESSLQAVDASGEITLIFTIECQGVSLAQKRDGFSSMDEAGTAGSLEARQLTENDKDGYEYGGEVYSYEKEGNTLYGYTLPRRGGKPYEVDGEIRQPGPQIRSDMVPSGTTFLGGYHSHPSYKSFSYLDKIAVQTTGKTLYVGRKGFFGGEVVEVLRPTRQYRPPSNEHKWGLWKYEKDKIYD